MAKRYRLKKDLPNVKAGAIIAWVSTATWVNGPLKGGRYGIWPMPLSHSCDILFTPEDVESNTEWFEEIKPEWEIQCFTDGERNWWRGHDLFHNQIFDKGHDEEWFLGNREFKISQVKRLSDGEVFSVGDEVESHIGASSKIESFEVNSDNTLLVKRSKDDPYGYIISKISRVSKVQSKEQSFQWTEALVRELIRELNVSGMPCYHTDIERFKASKQPQKERIEVKSISSTRIEDYDSKDAYIKATLSRHPDASKMKEIRLAIEKILNQ